MKYRDVAAKLRQYRIVFLPSDVIHLDTGWFETDLAGRDYEFSLLRLLSSEIPPKLISDMKQQGFHI
jgi:alpha-D-xyloside xylohydrolase